MAGHTQRSPKRWTSQEDEILAEQVRTYNGQNETQPPLLKPGNNDKGTIPWRLIAESLPGRSNKDCRKRWDKIDKRWCRGPWQPDEETRLQHAVSKYGTAWVEVSSAVGTRNPDQCSKHWQNYLDPGLNRESWGDIDDTLLLDAIARLGHQWSQIQYEFPGRSKLDLRNRAMAITRRNKHSIGPQEHVHTPRSENAVPNIFDHQQYATEMAGLEPSIMACQDTLTRGLCGSPFGHSSGEFNLPSDSETIGQNNLALEASPMQILNRLSTSDLDPDRQRYSSPPATAQYSLQSESQPGALLPTTGGMQLDQPQDLPDAEDPKDKDRGSRIVIENIPDHQVTQIVEYMLRQNMQATIHVG